MKILNMLVIADTHGMLLIKENQDYFLKQLDCNPDIIACLGDIRKDELRFINLEINKKYGKCNIPWIGIKGNHDDFNQFDEFDILNVHNMMVIYKGIKIIGLEGSILYKNNMIGFTQDESLNIAKNMQQNADIILAHSHPWVEVDAGKSQYDVHVGLKGTRFYLDNNPGCICIHGHDHSDFTYSINKQMCYCIYGIKTLCLYL